MTESRGESVSLLESGLMGTQVSDLGSFQDFGGNPDVFSPKCKGNEKSRVTRRDEEVRQGGRQGRGLETTHG